MAAPSLNDLVTPETQPEALSGILSIAQSLGLSTTAWQPLGMARTILATMAQVVSNFSTIINLIAQGGYASYAAQMKDPTGNPITTWMTLISKEVYNVDRIEATFATGPVPIVNAAGSTYTFAAGQFHLAHPTNGKTYSNVSSISITGSSTTNVTMRADEAGTASSAGASVVLLMVTPLVGVTVGPLVTPLVGNDAETNQALLARDLAKLGSLSPNGPSQAYYYIATTTVPPSGTPINRVGVSQNLTTGVVTVSLANSQGVPLGPDIAAIDAAIQASVVPNGVTAIVQGATALNMTIVGGIWIPNATGLTSLAIQTAAETALALYYANLPIGGILDNNSDIFVVPINELEATIYNAAVALAPGFASRIAVVLTTPTGDTAIATDEVAVLTSTTLTVNFT